MAALKDIVVDCAHPASLARFWAAALDGYQVAPYDDAELTRLAENGVYDTEDDPNVLVEPTDGGGPRFFFQLVPEPKAGKNRLHLDLHAEDFDAEVTRLHALGARTLTTMPTWLTLADPEGNEFCLSR